MILVDSNIPMYLIGSPHPHKTEAQRLLEKLIADRERLVTDAEVSGKRRLACVGSHALGSADDVIDNSKLHGMLESRT